MLRSIYIDNYALIEKLELELGNGLSIITGETGAGKSILLGALGLLQGKRADTSVLSQSGKKCIVEGVFNIADYGLQNFFEENDIDYHDETTIRREISSSGKSRAFINDTPATLNTVQDLSLKLIDIHSQHQNLSLNNEEYILWIIDAYAGTSDIVLNVSKAYHEYASLKREYEHAHSTYEKDKQNLDFLTHQFNELKAAELKSGEIEELEKQLSILTHAEEIKLAFESSEEILSADEVGILQGLKNILDQLTRIQSKYDEAVGLHQRIESAYIELKDLDTEFVNHSEQVEIDPDRLDQVNQRIDQLNTLLYKYKLKSEDELIALRDTLDQKLQHFAMGDYELEKLKAKVDEQAEKLDNLSEELSQKRKKTFDPLSGKTRELLHTLGMKHARFSIRHQHCELSASGKDQVQFYFSANENFQEQNISKVASGGELSRLMLAIKYLISGSSGLPTIVFDEIDTGVSGEIADKVGNLIRSMASGMQVINITHLPQVASKGDHHYLVFKDNENGATRTLIRKLNEGDRLTEIARMLSGDAVTDAAIANARELLGR